ncbi:zinc-binding dehydrogenase [Salipaludibacillus aurantiacus]|uniref:NADPH:quinone reductase n=1 Tax=Salipaludibacillus aurantiacus TaxID=1601833 RepID=A0A1H9VL88_9BACI|nr:zinc-binding dehydrogenase [Salipaludibacillus aurantiacus]SES22314.1 NADPH:quinone reductase [Salipaludibacillus aurantiacus]
MKALALEEAGGNLKVMDVPVPEPEADQVLVKVHSVGLNPVDYKLANSPLPEWQFPHIPGLDVAGVVEKTGENVTGWQPGDKVYYHGSLAHQGGFAEYSMTRQDVLAPLPEGLSFNEAAALPTPAFTAYQSLNRKVPLRKGQTILVQAGAGGVGGFAIQLAHLKGLDIITTCSPENTDHVKKLGASKVIDYNTENVVEEVHKYTEGRGVDIVMDMVGGQAVSEAMDMLAFNGHLVSVVELPDMSQYEPKSLALSIHEVALGFVYRTDDERQIADLGHIAREVGELAASKKLDPLLEEVVTLDAVPETLSKINEGHVRGNIVCQIVG